MDYNKLTDYLLDRVASYYQTEKGLITGAIPCDDTIQQKNRIYKARIFCIYVLVHFSGLHSWEIGRLCCVDPRLLFSRAAEFKSLMSSDPAIYKFVKSLERGFVNKRNQLKNDKKKSDRLQEA